VVLRGELGRLRFQVFPLVLQPADVVFQMSERQPLIGQRLRALETLLFENLATPIGVFQALRERGLVDLLRGLVLGQRAGVDAGLLHQQQQQDDQRPHRADEHGEERKQGNADLRFVAPAPRHAARPWTEDLPSSMCRPSPPLPSRVLSRWIAADRLMTVSSKFLLPASAARLALSACSSFITSPVTVSACCNNSVWRTISCCCAWRRRAFSDIADCHCCQRCCTVSALERSILAISAACLASDCCKLLASAACTCSVEVPTSWLQRVWAASM